MIHKYLFKKFAHNLVTKIAQGDRRGFWAYIKKTAIGLVIGGIIVIVALIVGFIFLVYFLISAFTNSAHVESFNTTKDAVVTEIINTTQKVNPENIIDTITQTKETVAPAVSVLKEGEAIINTIETYIQKFENLLP